MLYDDLKAGMTQEELISRFTEELNAAKKKIAEEDIARQTKEENEAYIADCRYDLAAAFLDYIEALEDTAFENRDLYVDGIVDILEDIEKYDLANRNKQLPKNADEYEIYQYYMDIIINVLALSYCLTDEEKEWFKGNFSFLDKAEREQEKEKKEDISVKCKYNGKTLDLSKTDKEKVAQLLKTIEKNMCDLKDWTIW